MKAVFLPDLSGRDLKSTSKVLKSTCSLPLLDPKDGVCLQLGDVRASKGEAESATAGKRGDVSTVL